MIRKQFALCALGALTIGSVALASPAPAINCSDYCAESIFLPNGTFCVLDGCLNDGTTVFYCEYSCFWALPPWGGL